MIPFVRVEPFEHIRVLDLKKVTNKAIGVTVKLDTGEAT